MAAKKEGEMKSEANRKLTLNVMHISHTVLFISQGADKESLLKSQELL